MKLRKLEKHLVERRGAGVRIIFEVGKGMYKRVAVVALILTALCRTGMAQTETVVVRPEESDEVLVNPGMGVETFQRFNGQPLNEGLKWSEEGPLGRQPDAAAKPDFPASSVAYCRWFWSALESSPGQFRWEIIDAALEEARRHGQTLAVRNQIGRASCRERV